MSGEGAPRDKSTSWALPRRDTVLTLAVWIAPGLALALGLYALMMGNVAEIGRLRLISALHPGLYAALTVLTARFLISLFRPRPSPSVLLAAHVVVFAILIFGAATIIEPLPPEISGWLHVGFADYIARTGGTLPELDARFSSPGFFALVAMVTRAAGMKDAMRLLGWTPVVLNLLYGAVVFRPARATSSDARSAWFATWLFFHRTRNLPLTVTSYGLGTSLVALFGHQRRGRVPPRPARRRWGDPALAPVVAEDGATRGAGHRASVDESGSGSNAGRR